MHTHSAEESDPVKIRKITLLVVYKIVVIRRERERERERSITLISVF